MCTQVSKSHVKDPENTKKRIVKAATKNFAKKGYANTTVDLVAKSAKVSKGGLYHHFQSKEDLFIAVLFQNIAFVKETNSALYQNPKNLLRDLGETYDNVMDGPIDLARIWVEGVAESMYNPKLRKLLESVQAETVNFSVSQLKEIQNRIGLLEGFTDSELTDLAHLGIYVYKGVTLDKIRGDDLVAIKKRWIKLVHMIFTTKKGESNQKQLFYSKK